MLNEAQALEKLKDCSTLEEIMKLVEDISVLRQNMRIKSPKIIKKKL